MCNRLANEGIRVIVAGFDVDFSGKLFGLMPQLMVIAKYVIKVHAICVRMGGLTNYAHREVGQDTVVMILGKEIYEPFSCASFWEVMKKKTDLPKSQKEDIQEL